MAFDLLQEPLIQSDDGWHSLPGLFSAMSRGKVQGFPALRPHQRPAWHMFLVQLAVLALDAAGRQALPLTEDDWRGALRTLTPAFPDDEPWHLLGNDRSRPAFLQPPDPGGLKWSDVATPDALDMLITSRNHDVKREIAREAAAQDWIFALVSLQTMEGYQLKYCGTIRMKSGASSRVLLGLAPPIAGTSVVDVSGWWKRDVEALVADDTRKKTAKKLLWLEPWAVDTQLDFTQLDQLFIEVCSRVRLAFDGGRLHGLRSTVQKSRTQVFDWVGNSGDPWAPLTAVEGEALTLGARDFDHKLLVELLIGAQGGSVRKWSLPLLVRPRGDEGDRPMLIVVEAFARGKDGKTRTDGFKSRIVPVPKAMVARLFEERPVEVADDILKDIAATDVALRNGLALVAAGGNRDKVAKPHYARSQPAREVLRRKADEWFFPELWKQAAAKSDDDFNPLRVDFLDRLATVARAEFRAALPGIPCASLMRPRAEARGWQALERGLAYARRKLTEEKLVHV